MADKIKANAKVLMVIAPDQFRDEELLEPRKILQEGGCQVVVASCQAGEAKGMLGARCKPDLLIKDAQPSEFDAVIVVGGMGSPTYLWKDKDLHELLKQMDEDEKVVASICLSGGALAQAGVLSGKRATVWACPESLQALKDGNARYVREPVVQDGRTITAEGPEAAAKFGKAVLFELAKKKAGVP